MGIYRLLYGRYCVRSRLPHAGGDIPRTDSNSLWGCRAAPRRWGYTPGRLRLRVVGLGCPTQVGIYLTVELNETAMLRLPHAGGDIPVNSLWGCRSIWAAPRRWGYTLKDARNVPILGGCPTQVGIYLLVDIGKGANTRLPHAGGDIPIPY